MLRTLQDFLPIINSLGDREALLFSDGYRTRRLSYQELYRRIAAAASLFEERGIKSGDRLLLWGENRPEWLIAFWAAVAKGIQVVPIDLRSSEAFARRVRGDAETALTVAGEDVPAGVLRGEKLTYRELRKVEPRTELECAPVSEDDVVEIVYTSGTTGSPKGVPHRHRNICSNLRPFQEEIERKKWMARPFQPVRILDLLPLSHMFGQAMGLFIPVLLEGSAAFMAEFQPRAVVEEIRKNRISVLVCVPRILEQLRDRMERKYGIESRRIRLKGRLGIVEKWWKFRVLHSELGWKFWAVVVGGAPVAEELEAFWSKAGILTIQGYGLTEASPVVAVNHPFSAKRGSLGKALEGQEVKLAPDGEILVRGESVVAEYLGKGGEGSKDGWLHTGDIGEMDDEGRLYYRGRKKEMIVTSEGANVHPQDVESELNDLEAVKESCVVGKPGEEGSEQVHAVLILQHDVESPDELIQRANRQLEAHQKIRSWSIWPEREFPRTPSTLKIKRAAVSSRVREESGEPEEKGAPDDPLKAILSRLSGSSPSRIAEDMELTSDLGLSSLDRVELISRLEEEFSVELDETTLGSELSVGELRSMLEEAPEETPGYEADRQAPRETSRPEAATDPMPSWNRRFPVRQLRRLVRKILVLPLFHRYLELEVEGMEIFEDLRPPLLLAANHTSHLDTIAVLVALPPSWRDLPAPAMAKDRFRAHFQPRSHSWTTRISQGLQYGLACALFNAYPLPQRLGGIRQTVRYTGELVDQGYCPLIFPEGLRSEDGTIQSFKPGIGLMARELELPVIPIHLKGLFEIMSVHDRWPGRGSVRVRFGEPMHLGEVEEFEEAAKRLEERIRELE